MSEYTGSAEVRLYRTTRVSAVNGLKDLYDKYKTACSDLEACETSTATTLFCFVSVNGDITAAMMRNVPFCRKLFRERIHKR